VYWHLGPPAHDHAADAAIDGHPAPGKVSITSQLLTRRRASEPAPAVQRRAATTPVTDDPFAVHLAAEAGVAGGGGELPHRGAIQRSFGHHDVSRVRAHVGGAAAEAAAAIGARAYATGDAVAFAEAPSLELAAHEAAHVVQQRGGVRLAGGVGATGDAYERHADEVAARVVRGEAPSARHPGAPRRRAGGAARRPQPRRHRG
jgi:hypothetical protein